MAFLTLQQNQGFHTQIPFSYRRKSRCGDCQEERSIMESFAAKRWWGHRNLFSDSVKLNFDSDRLQMEVSPPQKMKLQLLLPGQKKPLCSWSHLVCIPTPYPEGVPGKYYLMAKWTCSLTSATHNIYLQNCHLLNTQFAEITRKIYTGRNPVAASWARVPSWLSWPLASNLPEQQPPAFSHTHALWSDRLWVKWLKCVWSLCEIWLRPGSCA